MPIVYEQLGSKFLGREIVYATSTIGDIPKNDNFCSCKTSDDVGYYTCVHEQSFGKLQSHRSD